MSSKEIFALRKQGRSADALELARSEHPENANDIWFLRAYAWALYDHIKSVVDRYEAKQLSPTALSSQISPYMREFARIGGPLRGDSAFSQIIRLSGKVSKDWGEFLGFAWWAGVEDFPEEDKKSFVNEHGKTLDSLQKRFTRAICREAAANAENDQISREWIDWALSVLEKALSEEPNDQWLNYYQSKIHLSRGESSEAIKRLAPVLNRQTRAAWPWAQLGEILEPTRPDDALICYAYATKLAREEQEVAKVRIHLAERLALAGRFGQAAQQVRLALRYREQHGFKVPQELQQLAASDWYQQAVAGDAFEPLPSVELEARALSQALNELNLSYTPGVIDHINEEKGLSYVATAASTGVGLLHRRFPEVADLPPGTIVEVARADPDGPAVRWRPTDLTSIPGLCQSLSGTLERQEGQSFAFARCGVADVFVAPQLAQAFDPGCAYEVVSLAIRRTNKQGKTGWRAVKILDIQPSLSTDYQ